MAKTKSTQVPAKKPNCTQFHFDWNNMKRVSITSFSSSKLILVVFMCNHCPYVKARIRDIVDFSPSFTESEFQIVAINSNDPDYQDEGFENMKKFGSEQSINFPYLFNKPKNYRSGIWCRLHPRPFLFDSERKLVFHGKINDALEPDMTPKVQTMEDNVRKLLAGQELEKEFDPSIGCQ